MTDRRKDSLWGLIVDAEIEHLEQASSEDLLREAIEADWDIEVWAASVKERALEQLSHASAGPAPAGDDSPLAAVHSAMPPQAPQHVCADQKSPPVRDWRGDLCLLWPLWHEAIEAARSRGEEQLPALVFRRSGESVAGPPDAWVREPSHWACMARGLGDWARFALMSYLVAPAGGASFNPMLVERVPGEAVWAALLAAAWSGRPPPPGWLRDFDDQAATQRTPGPRSAKQRAARLRRVLASPGVWDALARAASSYVRDHSTDRRSLPLKGAELRNHRFAGPHAVTDFIAYINTGRVPPRQAPFPDELADLGIAVGGRLVRDVPFLSTARRLDLLRDMAAHLAYPPPASDALHPRQQTGAQGSGTMRITCLHSTLQPKGLVATCRRLIAEYDELCAQRGCRRLQVIFIPVGLEAKTEHVSRRSMFRDLHRKLVVKRAALRGEQKAALSVNPTGEQVDTAIAEIRDELARAPALLVFGIYQVPPADLGELQEDMLESPLPHIVPRLLPQTGEFRSLTDPDIAHATQLLILSDKRLDTLARLPVTSFELPELLAEQFDALLSLVEAPILTRLRRVRTLHLPPIPDSVSNEIELRLAETALALQERSAEPAAPGAVGARAITLVWGKDASSDPEERVRQLAKAILEHLIDQARLDPDASWLVTQLHIASIMPAGVRLYTLARVMTGYLRATAACDGQSRPAWCRDREAQMWCPRADALSNPRDEVAEHRELEVTVQQHAESLKDDVAGLLRGYQDATSPGFDEHRHPYETPEVPPYKFDFQRDEGREQLEFLAPLVRETLLEELAKRFPEKHSLLQRLVAEECIRRAAIVQAHRADTDPHSLIEKRYLIMGIHHGLKSLKFALRTLLSAYGRERCRWLIPHLTRLPAFFWIYQNLYAEQLNGNDHELSQRHGAELVKRRLLLDFLAHDPAPELHQQTGSYRQPSAIGHFMVRSKLLQGLAHSAVRRLEAPEAQRALEEAQELTDYIGAKLRESTTPTAGLLPAWRSCIDEVRRTTASLMLDAAVKHMAGSPISPTATRELQIRKVVRQVFTALEEQEPGRRLDRRRLAQAVFGTVWRNLEQPAQQWQPALVHAVQEVSDTVPEPAMQCFYDLLMRCGELVAHTGGRQPEDAQRLRWRLAALIVFEIAETLRTRHASAGGHVLAISTRPARTAARVCLVLSHRHQDSSRWFQERAEHYCFQLMSTRAQQRIDRIAVLILRAMTVRLCGTPDELPLAMQFLKNAERALIHYPDRTELWIRFYLERAKVFRDRALQPGITGEEFRWCETYCRSDIAAITHLCGEMKGWNVRAQRILKSLPSPARRDSAPGPAAGSATGCGAGAPVQGELALLPRSR